MIASQKSGSRVTACEYAAVACSSSPSLLSRRRRRRRRGGGGGEGRKGGGAGLSYRVCFCNCSPLHSWDLFHFVHRIRMHNWKCVCMHVCLCTLLHPLVVAETNCLEESGILRRQLHTYTQQTAQECTATVLPVRKTPVM